MRHFLSSDDIEVDEQAALVSRAAQLKVDRTKSPKALDGMSVGMIFEKPSTRTRVSFETAINELGGHAVVLRSDELQLGRGETLHDTARVLSRYLHALVIRTFGQDRLDALAETSTIPIINALSDAEHPCQALADVLTVSERFPDPSEVRFVYVGDGNNVCHSLLIAGAKAGWASVEAACPAGFEPLEPIVELAASIGDQTGTKVLVSNDPSEAARGADVLYTDVWASMGQEDEKDERAAKFSGFQLDEAMLERASERAIVMHCLPAHRGEEISAGAIDGPASVVWDQAENRLHAQKALLEWIVKR